MRMEANQLFSLSKKSLLGQVQGLCFLNLELFRKNQSPFISKVTQSIRLPGREVFTKKSIVHKGRSCGGRLFNNALQTKQS